MREVSDYRLLLKGLQPSKGLPKTLKPSWSFFNTKLYKSKDRILRSAFMSRLKTKATIRSLQVLKDTCILLGNKVRLPILFSKRSSFTFILSCTKISIEFQLMNTWKSSSINQAFLLRFTWAIHKSRSKSISQSLWITKHKFLYQLRTKKILPQSICSQLCISTKKNPKINYTIKKHQEELGSRLMTALKNFNE